MPGCKAEPVGMCPAGRKTEGKNKGKPKNKPGNRPRLSAAENLARTPPRLRA